MICQPAGTGVVFVLRPAWVNRNMKRCSASARTAISGAMSAGTLAARDTTEVVRGGRRRDGFRRVQVGQHDGVGGGAGGGKIPGAIPWGRLRGSGQAVLRPAGQGVQLLGWDILGYVTPLGRALVDKGLHLP